MKQLQNNYTTPEQSNRLLELGVPAESADCYYDGRNIRRLRSEDWTLKQNLFIEYSYFTPCWSATRLMEIYDICDDGSDRGDWLPTTKVTGSYINYVIQTISAAVKEGSIDFSKLEE